MQCAHFQTAMAHEGECVFDNMPPDLSKKSGKRTAVSSEADLLLGGFPALCRLSCEEAVRRLLESAGTQFDPVVVRAFVEIAEQEVADVFAATGTSSSAVI